MNAATHDLHDAIMHHNVEKFTAALGAGADLEAPMTAAGTPPLLYAANHRYGFMVMKLLETGANPSGSDHHGYTPLHAAIAMIQADVFDLLLKYKADINAKTADGMTPLHLAVRFAGKSVGMLVYIDKLTRLHPEITKDATGKTPFMLASDVFFTSRTCVLSLMEMLEEAAVGDFPRKVEAARLVREAAEVKARGVAATPAARAAIVENRLSHLRKVKFKGGHKL